MRPQTLVFLILFSLPVFAAEEVTQNFTLDGRLYSDSAATTPLADIVSLKIQILNSAQDCILYEETQIVNTTTSLGYYTIQVGQKMGPPAGKRSSGDSNNAFANVFSNTVASVNGKLEADGVTACTYNPVVGDARYLKFTMTPSDLIARTTTTNIIVDSVPMALVAERAETLRGYTPANFIQVNTGTAAVSQANLETVFNNATSVARLAGLAAVPNSSYVQTGANGSAALPSVAGNPAGPSIGQFWYDSTNNVFKYYDGAVKTLSTGGGGSGALSDITAATAANTIANAAWAQNWAWDSLSSGNGLNLTAATTAAASNTQTLFNVATSGANANNTQTTYGAKFANTHTGTDSSNVGLYATASGGTNNYAGIFDQGNVGVGTAAPLVKLDSRGTNAKATTAAVEYVSQVGSTDAASPLAVMTGVKTDATATNRFGAINVDDAGTGRPLLLSTTNGGVGIGHTAAIGAWTLAVSANSATTSVALFDDNNGSRTTGRLVQIDSDSANNAGYDLLRITNGNTANSKFVVRGDGNVGIGIAAPTQALHIVGTSGNTLKIVDGNQGNGKVLTSDANGVASWAAPSAGIGSDANANFYTGNTAMGAVDTSGSGGYNNHAFGNYAGSAITTGDQNVMMGRSTGLVITTGSNNSAFGDYVMHGNGGGGMTGSNNTGVGASALYNARTTAADNTALGYNAGTAITTGTNNLFIGSGAGANANAASSGNVILGYNAGPTAAGAISNKLYIDNSVTDTPLIYGDFSTDNLIFNGTVKITGGVPGAGKVLTSDADGDATWEAPGVATPAGANTQVQFNDAGSSAGDAGLTYNKTTDVLSVTGGVVTPTLTGGPAAQLFVIADGAPLRMYFGSGHTASLSAYGGTWTPLANDTDMISVEAGSSVLPNNKNYSEFAMIGTLKGANGTVTGSVSGMRLENTFGGGAAYVYNGNKAMSQLSLTPTLDIAATSTSGFTGIFENLTVTSAGTGAVNLMDLQTAGSSKFLVRSDGNVGIGTNSPGSGLQLVNDAGADTKDDIVIVSYGAAVSPTVMTYKARGTAAAATTVLNGDFLGTYATGGYNGATYHPGSSIATVADDDFNISPKTNMVFYVNGGAGVSEAMRITSGGNLQAAKNINTTTGQIFAASEANGGFAINWDNGNLQSSTAVCDGVTPFNFTNMKDGGSYTLIVTGAAATGACKFNDSTPFTYKIAPANAIPVSPAIYTLIRIGNEVFISWINGTSFSAQ